MDMGNKIILSILVPAITERMEKQIELVNNILFFSEKYKEEVEILSFLDNRKRTIGEKRDGLVQLAQGQFCTFVDDDDGISEDYFKKIIPVLKECNEEISVVCFNILSIINNYPCDVNVHPDNINEQLQWDENTKRYKECKRKPFHNAIWRTSLAQSVRFPKMNYGEDWHWASRLNDKINKFKIINKTLYIYNYNDKITKAFTDNKCTNELCK
jgi:hypothetical protein